MERWPSGLRRTPGKRVHRKVSGVRIPVSPPEPTTNYARVSGRFHAKERGTRRSFGDVHLSRKAGHPQGGPVVRCGFCAAPLWGSPAPRGAGNPRLSAKDDENQRQCAGFLRRTGLREARFSAGVVKQKARMNAVHRVFIGFPATPSSGVHSRREARVIPFTLIVQHPPLRFTGKECWNKIGIRFRKCTEPCMIDRIA